MNVDLAAGHNHASAAAVHPDIHSDPTADYRNLGLLQLLKKASRRRGGASVHPTSSAAQHSLVYAQTGQDVHSLGRAQSSLHSHAGQCVTHFVKIHERPNTLKRCSQMCTDSMHGDKAGKH